MFRRTKNRNEVIGFRDVVVLMILAIMVLLALRELFLAFPRHQFNFNANPQLVVETPPVLEDVEEEDEIFVDPEVVGRGWQAPILLAEKETHIRTLQQQQGMDQLVKKTNKATQYRPQIPFQSPVELVLNRHEPRCGSSPLSRCLNIPLGRPAEFPRREFPPRR